MRDLEIANGEISEKTSLLHECHKQQEILQQSVEKGKIELEQMRASKEHIERHAAEVEEINKINATQIESLKEQIAKTQSEIAVQEQQISSDKQSINSTKPCMSLNLQDAQTQTIHDEQTELHNVCHEDTLFEDTKHTLQLQGTTSSPKNNNSLIEVRNSASERQINVVDDSLQKRNAIERSTEDKNRDLEIGILKEECAALKAKIETQDAEANNFHKCRDKLSEELNKVSQKLKSEEETAKALEEKLEQERMYNQKLSKNISSLQEELLLAQTTRDNRQTELHERQKQTRQLTQEINQLKSKIDQLELDRER